MKPFAMRWLGVVLFTVLVLSLSACSGAGQPTAAQSTAEPTLPPVRSASSIMAEGRVVPAQESELSLPVSGVVAEVLVAEGSQVKAGQPLVRLVGDEQLSSAVAAAELELLTAEQALKDLEEGAELARAQAQLDVAAAKKELDKAEKRTYSKEYRRGDDDQVDIARANYVVAEDSVTDAIAFYDQFDHLGEDNPDRAEALAQLGAARQRRDTALANLNYLLSIPNEMDVAEIDAQLAVAQAKLAEAELRLAKVQDGPNAAELTLAQSQLKNAQLKVAAAQASLKDLELLAPYDGTISAVEVVAGEFVAPGIVVVRMADFTWVVESTDLTELNIARVQQGMPAMIKFDALPDVELVGRADHIKPLGENRQGDIVYTVILKLDEPDERLRWNMTASITFLEEEGLLKEE